MVKFRGQQIPGSDSGIKFRDQIPGSNSGIKLKGQSKNAPPSQPNFLYAFSLCPFTLAPCSPPHGVSSLLYRILSYRTLPRMQLELLILPLFISPRFRPDSGDPGRPPQRPRHRQLLTQSQSARSRSVAVAAAGAPGLAVARCRNWSAECPLAAVAVGSALANLLGSAGWAQESDVFK